MRPTKIDGPAMLFLNIKKGHKDAEGVDRPACKQGKSCGTFGMQKEELGKLLCDAALHPIEPVVSDRKHPARK